MPTTPDRLRPTRVLGLGNPLMADDGLGLAVLDELRSRWSFAPDVELVDGGTWGMNLLPLIEDAERLIVLDAVRVGAPPGTLHQLTARELPWYFSHKLSPHQIDLKEVLALAELRGRFPTELVVLGAEPETITLRASLSPAVARQVAPLAHVTVERLIQAGYRATPRAERASA